MTLKELLEKNENIRRKRQEKALREEKEALSHPDGKEEDKDEDKKEGESAAPKPQKAKGKKKGAKPANRKYMVIPEEDKEEGK